MEHAVARRPASTLGFCPLTARDLGEANPAGMVTLRSGVSAAMSSNTATCGANIVVAQPAAGARVDGNDLSAEILHATSFRRRARR